MDSRRFDRLTEEMGTASRRAVMRVAIAAIAAAIGVGLGPRGARAVCRNPGSRCDRDNQCCSGECKKKGKNKRKRCAPLPANAFGCTIDDAACVAPKTPCPGRPQNSCQVTLRGKPVCDVTGNQPCQQCQSNTDCSEGDLGVGALCIRCAECTGGTTCICPAPVP